MPPTELPAFVERRHYADAARAILDELESRTQTVVADVHAAEIWVTLVDPRTPGPKLRAILREIFLSVCQYQPRTTEAGFTMLGRLPKDESRLLRSLMLHKCEEAEHGEWARRDFMLCGGVASRLVTPPEPAAFAVAGVWWELARSEDPFAYLGAEYLFERLTMCLAPQLVDTLRARGLDLREAAFLVEHATEDVKHTNLISHAVLDVATRYPHRRGAILRGFECFAQVYPIPVWREVMARVHRRSSPPAESAAGV